MSATAAKLCPHRVSVDAYCAKCDKKSGADIVTLPLGPLHNAARFTTTETGLELAADLSSEEWAELGSSFGRAHRASAWWVGDWINYANRKWGERYDQAQEITGLSYQHLAACAAVARRFDFNERSLNLTWNHHYKAKALANPEEWLARAESENWSARELQRNAKSEPAVPVVIEITTERQRQIAEANKLRVERAVGACNGLARGLDEIKTEQAIAVASPEELRGWDSSFRDAIAALKKFRAQIKEATP